MVFTAALMALAAFLVHLHHELEIPHADLVDDGHFLVHVGLPRDAGPESEGEHLRRGDEEHEGRHDDFCGLQGSQLCVDLPGVRLVGQTRSTATKFGSKWQIWAEIGQIWAELTKHIWTKFDRCQKQLVRFWPTGK